MLLRLTHTHTITKQYWTLLHSVSRVNTSVTRFADYCAKANISHVEIACCVMKMNMFVQIIKQQWETLF